MAGGGRSDVRRGSRSGRSGGGGVRRSGRGSGNGRGGRGCGAEEGSDGELERGGGGGLGGFCGGKRFGKEAREFLGAGVVVVVPGGHGGSGEAAADFVGGDALFAPHFDFVDLRAGADREAAGRGAEGRALDFDAVAFGAFEKAESAGE